MQYYLGQYIWNTDNPDLPFWQPPNSSEIGGVIDLRPLSAQGMAGGAPQGYCFIKSNNLIDNPDLIYLGDDKSAFTQKQKSELSGLLGINVETDSPVDLVFEVLTVKNDKTKVSPPLLPDINLKLALRIDRQVLKIKDLIPEVSPEWPVVLKQLQEDYVEIKNADVGNQTHRKLLTVYQEKYGIADTSKFIPVGQQIETPIPHDTTYTESFTASDGDTLTGDLTWTEVSGDIDIAGNLATHTAANSEAKARAEHDVSSTDHYAQIKSVYLRASSNTYVTGVFARYSTSAVTAYGIRALRTPSGGQHYEHQLFKFVTGTFTSLGNTTYSWAANDVIKVECNGSTIKGYLNAAEIYSVTDTAISGNTRGGITMYSNDGHHVDLDDFEIGDLGTPAVVTGIMTPRSSWWGDL